MTLLEDELDVRLAESGSVVRSTFDGSSLVPIEQLRSAQRRRKNLRSLALVFVAFGVGLFGWRTGPSQDVAATPTGVDEVEVDNVFGHDLGTDDVIWPAEPLPLEELLDTFTTEVLAWPSAESSEPVFNSVPGNSGWFVSIQHPTDQDRGVFLALTKSENGWAIRGFAFTNDLVLDAGQLVGLRVNRWSWESTEIESVTVYRSSADAQYRSVHPWPVEGEVLKFAQPLDPSQVGSVLVVARDEKGEAITVSGFVAGLPDQLTVDLDSLGPGLDRSQFADTTALHRPFDDSGVELRHFYHFAEVAPGVSVSLGRPADGSRFCFQVSADSYAASSCVRSLLFNQQGAMVALGSEDLGHFVLIVIPDGVEFGDVGDAVVHESGRFLVLVEATIRQADFEIVDGVLNLTS